MIVGDADSSTGNRPVFDVPTGRRCAAIAGGGEAGGSGCCMISQFAGVM